MSTAISGDYDLCLVRRSDQDSNVFAASVLGCHFPVQIGESDVTFDGYDVVTGQPVTVEYLSDARVTLISEAESAADTVFTAIQGIPTRGFRLLAPNCKVLHTPTVISSQKKWIQQNCRIRFQINFANNADVRALIRHARAFELAIGGLPNAIPTPRRSVESVANQYRNAANSIELKPGFVVPFNNSRDFKGFLVLKRAIGSHDYECDGFSRSELMEGTTLNRLVRYRDRVTGEEITYQSTVGEIIAVT